ncbi:MAG: YggT family protein [Deltaproteobacteria bacterium]|nr:YggT family protein [Deltaproteobacteria bacterium]
MFILGNFLEAVATVIHYVLTLFMWVVIARAVLSWVNPDPFNPIVRFIHNVTEPVLYRIRATIPAVVGGIDFSPIIVFLAIVFLDKFIVNNLIILSRRMLIG